jgi:hypothetical protein
MCDSTSNDDIKRIMTSLFSEDNLNNLHQTPHVFQQQNYFYSGLNNNNNNSQNIEQTKYLAEDNDANKIKVFYFFAPP